MATFRPWPDIPCAGKTEQALYTYPTLPHREVSKKQLNSASEPQWRIIPTISSCAPSHWSSKFFLLSKDIFLLMGQWLQVGDPSRDKKKLLQFNFLSTIFFLDEIPRCTESAVEICRSAAQVEIRTRDFPDLTFEPATCPLVTRCTCYHCLTVVHCYHYCFSYCYYDHYLSVSALAIIADSLFIVAFVVTYSSWPYNLHLTLIIISLYNFQKNFKISTFSQNFQKNKENMIMFSTNNWRVEAQNPCWVVALLPENNPVNERNQLN